ncbi:glycosyl hydrolase family 17 protein [Zavarzinia sp. CC-PAN008]|uniref:glycoside hydrolase family 17 protein n=1 Tax=Zavarzinia sp. CC-PAN008 TaxID=3243332 RepID=UPI003F746E19
MRAFLAAGLCVGLIVLALAWINRPVVLDHGTETGEVRYQSVSYAPYRDGQSPIAQVFPTPAQIAEDLDLLATRTQAIRTYTVTEGMEIVPDLARARGLKMTIGAWLDSRLAHNEVELQTLIDTANRYPDVVTRVVVGNENLLRNDLTAQQLVDYIRRVQRAVAQPVSYADVWGFWEKYPGIVDEVDEVTVHILPYWEDVPFADTRAAEHLTMVLDRMAPIFRDRPVFVGEIGWPTAGRQREAAIPGIVEQRRFLAGAIPALEARGVAYNLMEAIDQRWKAAQEGTVGGAWGVYASDRTLKAPIGEAIVPDRLWPCQAGSAAILAILALLALRAWRLPAERQARVGALAALGGLGLALSGAFALEVTIFWDQWPVTILLFALQAALWLALLAVAARGQGVDGAAAVAGGLVRGGRSPSLWAGLLTWLSLVASLVLAALIVFDGRYRDFPTAHLVVAAFAPLLVGAPRLARGGWSAAPEAVLALALAGLAIALVWVEVWVNGQANRMAALMMLMAAVQAWAVWRAWRGTVSGARRPAAP